MSKQTYSIAHVGAFRRPSDGDSFRTLMAAEIYMPEFEKLPGLLWILDVINLKYGRDFLKEEKTYDVVILHSIFDPNTVDRPWKVDGVHATSPHHTVENWRRRLVQTGARLIFAFELLPCSLHGWRLGELGGYDMIRRDHELTVWKKKPEPVALTASKVSGLASQSADDHSNFGIF